MNQDMELWKQVFQELIQEVKPRHKWTLTEDKDLLPNSLEPGWSQYQQWAFARFQCSLCSRSWASSQVQVVFHMHKTRGKPRGNVKMRVFAQRCQKCHQSPFEVPEFTKENISRILNNLVFRILKKCYREGFKSMEEIPTIREITLEGPHDSNNCEACLQGFCAQSGFSEAVQSPVSPSLPAISSPALGTTIPMPFPSRSGTTVDTVKGNITVDRVKGNITADTVRGNITVDTMKRNITTDAVRGNITADTVKRNITTDAVRGNITADAVKRNIAADTVKRNITADTVRGNLTVDTVKKNITTDAVRGNITADAVKRNITADTVRGNLTVDTVKRDITTDAVRGNITADAVKRNITADTVRGNITTNTERGNSTVDIEKWNAIVNKGKALPQPWHPGSREAAILPTHWSPRANTQHHVETRIQVSTHSEVFYPHTAPNPRRKNLNVCCCFFILIIVVVIVVESIQWTSK
ncbi:receptor-transporting protein 3 [Mustela lutreola]|uniref:receptor-transporting protein 3 n=1 Tax=Mustela lutreola TaxID=9666 RepID=UPI0027974F20|nr:receptor-transporting protein 3 [Mustela lutreola]